MNFMPYHGPAHLTLEQRIEQRIEQRRTEADRRRRALEYEDCATFVLQGGAMPESITCLCCGLTSHNPWDIVERYCGFCRQRHSGEVG